MRLRQTTSKCISPRYPENSKAVLLTTEMSVNETEILCDGHFFQIKKSLNHTNKRNKSTACGANARLQLLLENSMSKRGITMSKYLYGYLFGSK